MPTIRPARPADLGAVRSLLQQLGYPLDEAEVRRRHDAVATAPGHAMMVAELDGRIVALCHMFERPALEKPPEVVVQALVVDATCRGTGVGNQMMAAAEAWGLARGMRSVCLSSDVSRDDAHAFYEARGYRRAGTSHWFRMTQAIDAG